MGDPFPPDAYRRRPRSLMGPLILLALGVIFLLQNMGLLSWQFWGSIWQYWPVILILIGLEMVAGGGRHPLLRFGVLLLVLAVIAGGILALGVSHVQVANFHATLPGSTPAISTTDTQSLEGASTAQVSLQFGAGNVTVGSLPSNATDLAQMTYQGPQALEPRQTFKTKGDQAQLTYRAGGSGGFSFGGSTSTQVELLLNPNIPIDLTVQEGANSSSLDLSKLRISNLTVEAGASTTSVTMPSSGSTTAQIKGGASTFNITIPPDVDAQIQYNGGLSTLNVDTNRFPSAGNNTYRSAGYDSAQNRVDLTIQAGVATVNVK